MGFLCRECEYDGYLNIRCYTNLRNLSIRINIAYTIKIAYVQCTIRKC